MTKIHFLEAPVLKSPRHAMPGIKDGVLLLQGPVGPFFGKLHQFLNLMGRDTWRVCFHRADYLHHKSGKSLLFPGGEADWREWLSAVLAARAFRTIILFGAQRPAHIVACNVAKQYGVRVICLEEGYIRPGYITVENDGNNATSPIAGQLPSADEIDLVDDHPQHQYKGLWRMVAYASLYYTVRGLTTHRKQRALFHRKTPLVTEAFYWMRNIGRRICCGDRNFNTIQNLLEHADRQYFLVPLQVNADANMVKFSNGWTSVRLIVESLRSFALYAPPGLRLVFKIHPMERGHNNLTGLITSTAEKLGLTDRVDIVETGSLGLLTRHSAGMITINSSSGLSAVFHGVPLLVLGRAIYRHPALARCGNDVHDFNVFWTSQHVAKPELRANYLVWLKRKALKPGDFYHHDGIDVACQSVFEKLQEQVRDVPIVYDQAVKLKVAAE